PRETKMMRKVPMVTTQTSATKMSNGNGTTDALPAGERRTGISATPPRHKSNSSSHEVTLTHQNGSTTPLGLHDPIAILRCPREEMPTMFQHWWRGRREALRPERGETAHPQLEALEDRLVPATALFGDVNQVTASAFPLGQALGAVRLGEVAYF